MLTTGETYVPDKPEASLPMRLRAWYAWLLKINFCFSAAAREEPHMNTPQNANWNSIHFVTVCIYQPRLSQKCPLSNSPPPPKKKPFNAPVEPPRNRAAARSFSADLPNCQLSKLLYAAQRLYWIVFVIFCSPNNHGHIASNWLPQCLSHCETEGGRMDNKEWSLPGFKWLFR